MTVKSRTDSWHQLAQRFDVFFVDLWGVLIDGEQCFPYAVEWLTFLKNRGKAVVLISNTPTLGTVMSEQLSSIGISPSFYQAIVTSGDTTRYLLRGDSGANKNILGSRYYYIGEAKHERLLQGLPYSRVNQPDEAEFILLTATDSAFQEPQDFEIFLEKKSDYALCESRFTRSFTARRKVLLCWFRSTCDYQNIPQEPFDVIINATSASIQGQNLPLNPAIVGPDTHCLECAYKIAEHTLFQEWAIAAGAKSSINGWGMLVEQAVVALDFFSNLSISSTPILKHYERQ